MRDGLVGMLFFALVGAGGGPAWADPETPVPLPAFDVSEVAFEPGDLEALTPAARQHMDTARREEAAGDWRRAEAAYGLVLRADSTFVPAVLGIGRIKVAQGDVVGALAVYARLPAEPEVVLASARLQEEENPERAVRLYRQLTTLRLGDPEPYHDLARVLSPTDAVGAAGALDTYLGLVDGAPDGEVMVIVAVALREAGLEEEAANLLEEVLRRAPDSEAADEARGRLDRFAVEQEARMLAVGHGTALPPDLRADLELARRMASRGEAEKALDALRAIVAAAPRSAEARAAMGDVQQLLGQVADAERAYAWAIVLAPDESAWHARMGMLLAERYGGRRHREAAESLQRALALRPSASGLHLELAQVYQGLREWEQAISTLDAFLAGNPAEAVAGEARALRADLARTAPAPLREAGSVATTVGFAEVPSEVLEAYRVARVYLDRGELEAARTELDGVLVQAAFWAAALNLDAALRLRQGDEMGAVASWARSLEADPAQPRVRLVLGELARKQGNRLAARTLLQEAAEGGVADAHYYLAMMAMEGHRLFDAARALDAFFATATGGLAYEPALELREEVDRKIRMLRWGGGGGMAGLVLALLGWWAWRRTGHPLQRLVDQAPEVVHDLARRLSAIRHEVLKHNTTLLEDVAHALEHGDHHAVAFAAIRLFGDSVGEPGVVERFNADLAAIERLGRQHGVRLDLRRIDPVLAPMARAMNRLKRLKGALRRPWRAGRGVPDELRALSVALNEEGYVALGTMLRQMGATRVTRTRIVNVDERVRSEPGLVDRALPALELQVPKGGVAARVFSGDLEDILANLLRNAYLAIEMQPASEQRVGASVALDEDPITGHEHMVLQVRDSAPGKLTSEMIHGRGIGRGLGLVVDLITRHDGSIGTCAVDGWSKAVEVRLPVAETTTGGKGRPGEVVA